MVKREIKDSKYDTNGNIWLQNNSSTTGIQVINGQIVGRGKVYVIVYSPPTGSKYYTISSCGRLKGIEQRISQLAKARDSFSKYLFFISNDYLNLGTTTIRGDIHTNKWLNFFYGEAKLYGSINAVEGFYYHEGATAENTHFYGVANEYADPLKIPPSASITDIGKLATGVYNINGDGTIQLAGNNVIINGTSYPLPSNGIISFSGKVSVFGELTGQLTIVGSAKIYITNNIRYIDAEGDTAYYYNAEGNYVPNPLYNGNACLGLMAVNDIIIPNSAPYNIEFNAALLSAQGRWYCELGLKKGNLRFVGSITSKYRSWRASGSYGYAQSGEYIYDANLKDTPPPKYLEIEKPLFLDWLEKEKR